ncbi:hypothetical protein QW060_20185 [Myroides ceti]|uniref:Uncharacterized protein n=1 Tax=Paenimyroides ceti TaxID=395087 RepID=A0ABT8CW69_9FLAO|nr:hypothetical protein [Paenimyroides ceti]MDN3708763.1 hypothetical protein [Paenimyroides ceti]MDN3709338.1 hypothetical protein [Paenimyroides ceti]
MENPFKKILIKEDLPGLIKDKVMDDIDLIKLTIDLSELYLVGIPQVFSSFSDKPNKDLKEDNNSKDNNNE